MPNKTIYFTQFNLNKLLKEDNPNGLINRLVMNYYAANTRSRPFRLVAKGSKTQNNNQGDDDGKDNE